MDSNHEMPDPNSDVRTTITVSQMITALQTQAMNIATNKKNRLLMMNAAYTIRQLVDRLAAYENVTNEPDPPAQVN